MFPLQCTIGCSVVVEGQGLHSGKEVRVTLFPGKVNQGIVFRVLCGEREGVVPALFPYAVLGYRSTLLKNGEIVVATVEHLLGACWSIGVDNLEVVVEGEELPGGDGSALLWLQAFERAGIKEQEVPRKTLVIDRVFHVQQGAGHLFAFPAQRFVATYILDCTEKGEFLQGLTFQEGEEPTGILRARTFAFLWEEEKLRKLGLGKGVQDEAVLLDVLGVGNKPFRLPSEACAHKILDLLGDLMLLGKRIQGGFLGLRSGHALNQAMVKLLWEAVKDGD